MKHYIAKEGFIYTLNDIPLGKEIYTPDNIKEAQLGLMSDEEYKQYIDSIQEPSSKV